MNKAVERLAVSRRRDEIQDMSPWHVVVVDDSEDDRAEIRRLLLIGSDRRFRFTEAETGEAALRICLDQDRGVPDCLVLDYHLPDMNAEEILLALRRDDELPPCPVVVLTENTKLLHARAVLRAGAQDFIGKGWMTAESLYRAVENAVERHAMACELRAREAELGESQQQLTLALQAANLMVFTWDIQADVVRRRLSQIDALPSSDRDEPGPSTIAEVAEIVHPEDRPGFVDGVRKVLEGDGDYSNQYRVGRPGGPVVWLEERGRVAFDQAGRPTRLVGVSADVTDRKRSEEQLRRREQELQSLADNTPDILTRFDRQLRHVFVNAAVLKATGRQKTDFLGRTNREIGMPTELCDRWETAMRSVFETGEPRNIEFDFDAPDGPRHYRAKLVPEFGPDGEVHHILGVTHDRTVEARAEQALREADRRKDEFLAMLAHELRTPLAAISNASRLLQGPDGDPESFTLSKDVIGRQLKQLSRLVDDLLDVSRISNGKVELRKELLDAGEVARAAAEVVRPAVEGKCHHLILEIDRVPLPVEADRARLEQVMVNLLNNAAKYSDEGGRITLSAGVEGAEVVLRVRDDGVGISREQLTRVFDLFSQVDTSLDRSQGGLGIGLTLVKRLVEMHGGGVSAASEGRGRGSEFTVRLPMSAASRVEGGPANVGQARDESKPDGFRVLVVDDSADTARTMSRLLDRMGYVTEVVRDGPAALEAVERFLPDAILLDIGLPGMNGYEVARTIRKPGPTDLFLIAITGYGQEKDKERALEAGFDRHMIKPIDLDHLDGILSEFNRLRGRSHPLHEESGR